MVRSGCTHLAARLFASVLAAVVFVAGAPVASASTIVVDTTQDGFGANGRCGLRDAVQAAQTDAVSGGCSAGSGGDVVTLPAGRFELTLVGAHEDANQTGDLDLLSGAGAVTIQGAGSDLTTIDALRGDRVMEVLTGAKVTIDGVEITGGHAPDGASGSAGDDGGGIRNTASLTLRDSLVDDNTAGDGGAGAAGPAGSSPSFITGGSGGPSTGGNGGSGGFGGGIFNTGGLVVERTRVAGNRAGAGGGAGAGGQGGFASTGAMGTASGSGGTSTGGIGGLGGAGGGIFASLGLHLSDSTVVANRGGVGGAGGNGGTGGDGAGFAGSGGSSFGGAGGHGGGGGGIVAGAGSDVHATTVTANDGGTGGKGGNAGTGGTFIIGAGQAAGGSGGGGGAGGGLSGSPTATNVTIAANRAGAGGAGGLGGAGGAQIGGHETSPGGSGGAGGTAGGGDGITLVNATLASNRAGAGGSGGAAGSTGGAGGSAGAAGAAAAVRDGSLRNSIIASDGASGCDGAATPADNGGNITFQSGAACPGTTADPGLGPLADNGGATETMAPAVPGPAIDAGVATGCPATDQRGAPRPIGAACDAGAYEAGATVATGDATAVTLDSASLPGTITPTLRPTTFHFEYGKTDTYGSATPDVQAVGSAGTTSVGVTIAGLEPSTTYHYRLVAVNPDAAAAFVGADKTFTTADAPSPPIQQPQQPSDQGQTPTTTPPVTTPPVTTGGGTPNPPVVRGTAFIADSGGALVRLDKRGRFKLPGLSFSCPKDASGRCTAKISLVAGASGAKATRALASVTLTVAPGKAGTATFKASKSLIAQVKKKGFLALTAKATFAAPGARALSAKKAFVLLKRGR